MRSEISGGRSDRLFSGVRCGAGVRTIFRGARLPKAVCTATACRSGNRLRYLAMLQHDKKVDESGYDELRRWLGPLASGRTKPPMAVQQTLPHIALSEPALVALAALREVYGADWRERLQPEGKSDLECMIRNATKKFANTLEWPPNAIDLDAFDELLNGIKVSEVRP